MKKFIFHFWLRAWVPAMVLMLGQVLLAAPKEGDAAAKSSPPVRVGMLTYGGGKTSKCFASGFLDDVARQTHVRVERGFTSVALDGADLFEFPFIVFSGEGAFTLGDAEVRNLRVYLQHGGLVLASAGCSSQPWIDSFRAAIKQALPDSPPAAIPMEHAIFHTLYEVESLRLRQTVAQPVVLEGVELEGRLVVVFSTYGLNDTANAGGNCCCCGGNEIRDAHLVNANVLAYALTH